jgi:hypothetical protein
MSPWASAILAAFGVLAIRALIAWLIERYADTAECDADLGDAGSGDTRICVENVQKFRTWRRRNKWLRFVSQRKEIQ